MDIKKTFLMVLKHAEINLIIIILVTLITIILKKISIHKTITN